MLKKYKNLARMSKTSARPESSLPNMNTAQPTELLLSKGRGLVIKSRKLLAVIKVTAKGNNGTEATEHFAMLVGSNPLMPGVKRDQ